jgi:type I restriction enzyme S subunit
MKYQTYPAYKDSGVEWLGDVPEHWNLNRFKNIFRIRKRIAGKLGFNVLSITQKGVKVKDTESGDGQLSMDYSKYQLVYQGDYAMNHMDLLTGFVDISQYDGVTSPDYRVFTLEDKNSNKSYYLYLLQLCYIAKIFYPLGQGAANIGRWRLPSEAFHEFIAPLPNLDEQQKIAQFLDHETAKIDTLIEKQQRLIELLKEKRQAVISHAVTKGLNPNAPMKESGVEWLGDVPEHWELPKLIHKTTNIGDGLHSTPQYEDGTGYYFVNGNNLVDGKILIGLTAKEVPEKDYKQHYIKLDSNSVLLSINGTIGNVARYNGEQIILGKSAAYMNCENDLLPEYLMLYLQSSQLQRYFDLEVTGTTIFNLSLNSIRKMKVCIPPQNEQIQIEKYCVIQKKKYDALVEKANSAIELMQERRTALISAAVTGKIDVRDWGD